jgi:hypothetical protein
MTIKIADCLIDEFGEDAVVMFVSNSQASLCATCGQQIDEPYIFGHLEGHTIINGNVYDLIKRIGEPCKCNVCFRESYYIYLTCYKYNQADLSQVTQETEEQDG